MIGKICITGIRSVSVGKGTFSSWPSRRSHFPQMLTLIAISLLSLLLLPLHARPASATPSGAGPLTFHWPVKGQIICPFREASGHYGEGGHSGIDIRTPVGTDVRASASGIVTFAGETPVGVCVSISHGEGMKTTYVDLAEAKVRRGTRVEMGTVIGRSDGSKDRSTPVPHLHFGVYLGGKPIDPLLVLNGKLLDPSRDLFLGPWEDIKALREFIRAQGGDGLLVSLVKGVISLGERVINGINAGMKFIGAVGKAVWNFLVEVFSNRFVKAIIAAIAAIAVISCLVLAVALTFGVSLGAAVVAMAMGAVTSFGFAIHNAFVSGNDFSLLRCFLGCLLVGGSVALGTVCFAHFSSLLAAGWSKLGILGMAKTFIVHGMADSLSCAIIGRIAGHPLSLSAFFLAFLIGGLVGSAGKLFVAGLSRQVVDGILLGGLSTSSSMESISFGSTIITLVSEGEFSAMIKLGFLELSTALAEKVTYVVFCGCTSFLADFMINLARGTSFSLGEAIFSFFGGVAIGGISLVVVTFSPAKLLRNAIGSCEPMGNEFLKAFSKKIMVKEGKHLLFQHMNGGDGIGEGGLIPQGSDGN